MQLDAGLLEALRRKKGLTQKELAKAAGYSEDYISQIERRVNKPKHPETVARLASALDVRWRDLVLAPAEDPTNEPSWNLEWNGGEEDLMSALRSSPRISSKRAQRDVDPAIVPSASSPGVIRVDGTLDAIVATGVALEHLGRSHEAKAVLTHLVGLTGPSTLIRTFGRWDDPALKVVEAVATAYMASACQITGDHFWADRLFERVLNMIGDLDEIVGRQEMAEWDRWSHLTNHSRNDMVLWCGQMLAVAHRSSGRKGYVGQAVGRLMYVIREARRGTIEPSLVTANCLRDMAKTKMDLDPESDDAGRHLTESVELLADLPASGMLAVSLLYRSRWHKARGKKSAMDLDALLGLDKMPEDGSVNHAISLNTVAKIYADIEPGIAEHFATKALAVGKAGAHGGQVRHAEETLRKLADMRSRRAA